MPVLLRREKIWDVLVLLPYSPRYFNPPDQLAERRAVFGWQFVCSMNLFIPEPQESLKIILMLGRSFIIYIFTSAGDAIGGRRGEALCIWIEHVCFVNFACR